MFKVGQRVRVIDKKVGTPKEESRAWQELHMTDMVGEVVTDSGIRSGVVLVKALGEEYITSGVFLKSEVCHWSEIFLGEVEEL